MLLRWRSGSIMGSDHSVREFKSRLGLWGLLLHSKIWLDVCARIYIIDIQKVQFFDGVLARLDDIFSISGT